MNDDTSLYTTEVAIIITVKIEDVLPLKIIVQHS